MRVCENLEGEQKAFAVVEALSDCAGFGRRSILLTLQKFYPDIELSAVASALERVETRVDDMQIKSDLQSWKSRLLLAYSLVFD